MTVSGRSRPATSTAREHLIGRRLATGIRRTVRRDAGAQITDRCARGGRTYLTPTAEIGGTTDARQPFGVRTILVRPGRGVLPPELLVEMRAPAAWMVGRYLGTWHTTLREERAVRSRVRSQWSQLASDQSRRSDRTGLAQWHHYSVEWQHWKTGTVNGLEITRCARLGGH